MSPEVSNCKPDNTGASVRTPVERLIAAFGRRRVAEIAELTTDAVDKWNRRQSTGGGGGLVPARYQSRFLEAAKALDMELTAEDFIAEPVK
jgi:hypothetical protein